MSETASAGASSAATSSAQSSSGSPGQSTSQNQSGSSSSRMQSSGAQGGQQNQSNLSVNPNAQGAQAESQTQSQPRKLGETDMEALVTVKINGKTEELPLKEVIKLQQLEKASHEKMRIAAERERRAQELMAMDIDQLAKLKGLDLDSLAEERLAKKYELMQMSPEQRELQQLREERAQQQRLETSSKQQVIDQIKQFASELPAGIENATKEQLVQYLSHVQNQYKQTEASLEREIVDAWKESGLPKHKYFGALMSFHMMNHQKSTGEPLQAAQAASKVKQEFGGHVREILGQMDAQAIQEFLGKDLTNKLREFDVQRVTSNQASNVGQNQNRPGNSPASGQKQQLNQMEWRKAMGIA
jgi:hypothetical protein